MKKVLLTVLLVVVLLVFIGARQVFNRRQPTFAKVDKTDIISCGYAGADIEPDDDGKFINPLPGLGHHTFAISSGSDSARFYFNQGLSFYYSYHIREARASFKEAARFDNKSAIIYWGQALAMGPYYNSYYYKMGKGVPAALQLMSANVAGATGKEKLLVKAMMQRYSADTTNSDRVQLDSAYVAAMRSLATIYKNDNDIKALYVDAVMLQHKWDFWHNDGKPKPWTEELVAMCQDMLKSEPENPAALHYYIHVTEASKHPELALHSADVLKEVMPGAAHMVHMATHMYQRNGMYAKGVFVNEDAITVNNRVDSLSPALGLGKNKATHIFEVQSYCAMNAGMYNQGMPVYLRARQRATALISTINDDPYMQEVYMLPVIAWVRLGRWQDILNAPKPDTSWKYAMVFDNFARGLAYVNRHDAQAAVMCLRHIEALLPDSLLNIRELPFNKPVQCAKIAAGILKGELLYQQNKPNDAIAAFGEAVSEEDQLIYAEPQDWLIPARQYLGAYLLRMNKPLAAEKVYREDLRWNPGNGWSQVGLYNALLAQHKDAAASTYKILYTAAFKYADIVPVSSAF